MDARPDAAELYDWECRHVHHRSAQDVGFWLDLARRQAGPVLELACGTGRVTLPLAEAGLAVVGLDNDPVMLAGLAARALRRCRVLTVAADMRRFALAERFGAMFVAYNSIQLLTGPQDMVACFSCAQRHLATGGLFAVEVTDFQVDAAGGTIGDEVLADAEGIRLTAGLDHDLARRVSRYRRRFTGAGWAVEDEVTLRSLDRRELARLLRAGGLEPVRWWVDGPTSRVIAESAVPSRPDAATCR